MTDTWTTHYKGTVGGRPIEVQTYSEGGYRVRTNQGADYAGDVIQGDGGTIIMPSIDKEEPVDIEGDTIDEIRDNLAEVCFDSVEIDKIVSYFPII